MNVATITPQCIAELPNIYSEFVYALMPTTNFFFNVGSGWFSQRGLHLLNYIFFLIYVQYLCNVFFSNYIFLTVPHQIRSLVLELHVNIVLFHVI